MKKSHFWFLLEGLFCGVLQIVSVEYFLSSLHETLPQLHYVVPAVGVLLSSVGFVFLMRRFPGMKPMKYGFSLAGCGAALPAWFIYRTVLGIPSRELAEGEGAKLLQLIAVYAVAVLVFRAVTVLVFFIRKKLRKK